MGTTVTQVCNVALAYIGVSEQISDLGEASTAAEQCTLHYEQAVQSVFEECAWPELTGYATLALVEEEPNDDWTYSYRWPSDCLAVRRIVTTRGREDPNPPQFRNGADEQGLLIYTHEEEAQIEYTRNLTDPIRWSAHLADAVAWKLAEKLAPALSRMEKREQYCASRYGVAISQAKARSLNQQQAPRETDAEHIQARD